MAVDLDQFSGLVEAQEQGYPVQIRAPDGSDLGLTITVAGPDSDRQRKARQKQINRRLAKRNAAPMDAAEIEASGIGLLSETIISWSPAIKLGGKELSYSAENARKVLTAFPFIREQLDAAAGSRADFLQPSPPPSATA